MVVLRDGKKLIGILRSFDQFGSWVAVRREQKEQRSYFLLLMFIANLVLENTVERTIVGDAYCDIRRGIYLIRGENTVFLGLVVRWIFRRAGIGGPYQVGGCRMNLESTTWHRCERVPSRRSCGFKSKRTLSDENAGKDQETL
jgi:small nuclear ribonucleoprotein (snRNP)-like protein